MRVLTRARVQGGWMRPERHSSSWWSAEALRKRRLTRMQIWRRFYSRAICAGGSATSLSPTLDAHTILTS